MSTLSEMTKNNYRRWILWLQKEFNDGMDGLEFLKDHERIIEGIEDSDYKESSRKSVYTAIISTIRDKPTFEESLLMYRAVMAEYMKSEAEKAKSQQPTEHQQEAYVPWPKLLEAVDKQFEKMNDLWEYEDYMIMCLYTMNPPVRLDYANMKVVRSENEQKEGNLCVMGPRSGTFVFREYKNAKHMGEQRIKIAPKLFKIIKEWLKMSPDPSTLLLNQNGEPMNENRLGKVLTALFEEHTGKKVSVNALRHSYSTHYHKGAKSIKRKEEDARKMLHATLTNEEYAYKN